jgi:hypothetical protein
MKVNKQSEVLTISDLRQWFEENPNDIESLQRLHALLNKITNSMSASPVKSHGVGPFKQLKLRVHNRINTVNQNAFAQLQDRGANLV